jgi:hypothetical protein
LGKQVQKRNKKKKDCKSKFTAIKKEKAHGEIAVGNVSLIGN